ncbi:MAG: CCA tRNA nucleotidyltransferase [Clostridia bacterium]|nr:CCA tRNA nucleotidyltransferase [Clostridia bacterium]
MAFSIPDYVLSVLNQLNSQGFEGYVVGGCVRDMLIGTQPQDFDVCTNAKPEAILSCFAHCRTVLTGIQHGTVTVISDGHPIEITTYRVDGEYTDSRHPDGVRFTASLEEDLARRDFTVNAMAYHPEMGLVDLYGGRDDLAKKVIRCVGDPYLRFSEDALRILRGLRFAATLDFSLESTLVAAMEKLKDTLKKVAMERIFQEVTKLLCGQGAHKILQQYFDVLTPLFPPISVSLDTFSKLPKTPEIRYAYLLKDYSPVKAFMQNLRASNILTDQVCSLVALQNQTPPQTLYETRVWVSRCGTDLVEKALILLETEGVEVQAFAESFTQIREKELCCSLKELAVKGQDLLALGFPKGKPLGEALEGLLTCVMKDTVPNQKEALLVLAKNML